MRIAGLIVAAGESKRMGTQKPFVPFAGTILLDAVLVRFRPQVERLALNLRSESFAKARKLYGASLPMLDDEAKAGPVGGVISGLDWAASISADVLATCPCDTPFIPVDLVAQMRDMSQEGTRAVAAFAGGHAQNLCALWPVHARDTLQRFVALSPAPGVHLALDLLSAVPCFFPEADSFRNVNTPDELTEAEHIFAKRRRGPG